MCLDAREFMALCAREDCHLIGRLSERHGHAPQCTIIQATFGLPHALIVNDHGGKPGGSERDVELLGEIRKYRAQPLFAVASLRTACFLSLAKYDFSPVEKQILNFN